MLVVNTTGSTTSGNIAASQFSGTVTGFINNNPGPGDCSMVPAVPIRITSITRLTTPGHEGHILVQGTGAPNTAYHIEASPDSSPNSFVQLGPVNSSPSGALQYEDDPGTLTKRFYWFTYP